MNKIKVLVYGMTSNYGGVEAVIMNYYRNVDKSKIQFDFACVNDSMAFEDELKKNGSKVFKVGSKTKNYFKYKQNMKKIFKKHAKEYDIIWDNMCALSNIDALAYAKKYGIKTRIIHSHNSNMSCSVIKKLFHYINKNRVFRYANQLWACSEDAGKFMFGNNEFKVINNAIDLKKFQYDEEVRINKRRELEIKKDTLVIGNIGRFDTQKNHKFLIDIFKEIQNKNNNSILLLIGEGPLEEEIKDKIKLLKLEKNVKFLGKRHDISELYQAMDVFLLPSLYEGLGLVLVEAQATELTCFTSTKVPLAVKIIEKINFISLNESPKFWADEILKKSNVLSRKSNYYEIAECKYNIEEEAKKMQTFFEESALNYERE